MHRRLKKTELYLFLLFFSIFISLSLLHAFSGFADNGDFIRNTAFLFDKPYGFSTNLPPTGSEEWERKYYTQWHDKWIFLPDWPKMANLFTYSSYKSYLFLQAFVSIFLTGNSFYYSIIVGSVLSRSIIFATFCGTLLTIRAGLPLWVFCLFAVFFAVIFLDADWLALLNSFFEDQVAIIFLPVITLFLTKYYKNKSVWLGVFLLFWATYVASAKTAYFYLPILLSIFIFPIFQGKYALSKFFGFVFICQAIAFLPVHFGVNKEINSYHAVYYGALKALNEYGTKGIERIGEKPVVQECIGVQAFDPAGPQCMDRVNATYGDVARLFLSYPLLGPEMLFRMLLSSTEIRIHYLRNNISGAPDFTEIPLFNLVPVVFHYGGVFVLLFMSVLSVILLAAHTLQIERIIMPEIMLRVGLFMSCFGFSQYVVALGDGLADTTRHVIVGNYSLALSFAFLAPALLMVVFYRFVDRERI